MSKQATQQAQYPSQILWPPLVILIALPFVNSVQTTLLSILCAMVLFLAGWYLTRREKRIDGVVSFYLTDWSEPERPNGLELLSRAGAASLRTRGEMKAVCARIVSRTKQHPNWLPEKLPNEQLLPFLKFCTKHKHSLAKASDVLFSIGLWTGELTAKR
jgi:hypothetical protein